MKNIAVVLSGCGYLDGAEITESVSALISLTQFKANYQVFAPDLEFPTTNHLSGDAQNEKRNAMTEASRIARGKVQNLTELNPDEFDGVVFPGGFGAALNLSDWGKVGSSARVLDDVSKTITEFHSQSKPICAICIAPALVAKVLGSHEVHLTIGNDKETALEIEKTGAKHVECKVTDYVTDRENKIVTTPAYMFDDARPSDVFKGINSALKEFCEMA